MDELFNRVARQRRRGQRGFTLIELLVVIAVLAILAAIVIFNVLGVTNRGSSSACVTDKATVQTASDAYHNDNNAYPNTLAELVSGNYIHTAPTDLGNITWGTLANGGTISSDKC